MRAIPLFLACLIGCTGPDTTDPKEDAPADADTDTDADSDADSDADADSDSDADTDTRDAAVFTVSGDLTIAADFVVPPGEVVAVLLEQPDINAIAYGGVVDSLELGPAAAGVPLAYSLLVPSVPAEGLFHAPDPLVPTMELAVYAVGFYIDDDGDGVPSLADTYIGTSRDSLVFLRGDVSADAVELGADLGWNRLTTAVLGGDLAVPFVGDAPGVHAAGNLLPLPNLPVMPVSVEVDLTAGPAGPRRLDLWTPAGFGLGVAIADPTLVSVDLTSGPPPVLAELPAPPAPPDDHLFDDLGDGPIAGAVAGIYDVVAYVDADGDARFDPYVDPQLGASSSVVDPLGQRTILYLKATSFDAAQYSVAFGGALGWLLLADDGLGYGGVIAAPWSDGLSVQ